MTDRIAAGPRLTRRTLLATGAAGAATLAAPSIVRAQGTLRYLKPLVAGLNAKEGDPSYLSIQRIPEILREKYDVEMEIQIHPSSTLGTDLSQLEAVQIGFIDITSNVTGQFSQFSPDFTFIDLPYAITDWDMAARIFASDLWAAQSAKFAAATPMVPLHPVGAGGFRLLWNNQRPTPTPAEVDGLKFRTTQSPAEIALIRAWGGNPTPLAWTETYNGLKTGVIDGMHVQPIWTWGFNMHEVLKYATEADAVFAVQFQVINKNSYNSMPEEIRKRFVAAAADAAIEANALDRKLEDDFKAKLRGAGMEIYTPSAAEKKLWQDAGEALWAEYAKDIDPSVIERMVAMR
jgi:TRAP-type C4-dicarboxylate transport system substrate-binding protein